MFCRLACAWKTYNFSKIAHALRLGKQYCMRIEDIQILKLTAHALDLEVTLVTDKMIIIVITKLMGLQISDVMLKQSRIINRT